MLSRIFGSKVDKTIRGQIKLHNEESHNFYSSPDVIKMIVKEDEMVRAYITYGKGVRTEFW
jgi:hypothetical protein